MTPIRAIILLVLSVLSVPSRAPADIIYLTLSVTNTLFGTTNGNTLTVNADTRLATNNTTGNPSTRFLATNSLPQAATNLYRHLALYNFAGIRMVAMTDTNKILLGGTNGGALSFSLGGTWGVGVLSTSVNTRVTVVGVDPTVYDLPTQTNYVDKLVKLFNAVGPTNAAFSETAKALTNFANLSGAQTLGNKALTNSSSTNQSIISAALITGTLGSLTNGVLTNTHLQNPSMTNGQNFGNPFRSPGGGSFSEQFGYLSSATTNSATALGAVSVASGISSTAVGNQATASALAAVALGASAQATADNAVAIGDNANAYSTNSTAIGGSAIVSVGYPNSVALGYSANATDSNQVRLGSSTHTVSIPGNLTGEGTNTFAILNAGTNGGAVTLTNVSQAVRNQTVTNQNVLAGALTNVTIAASAATITNLQAQSGALTNVAGAFSGLTATNLQALSGMVSNSTLINNLATNLTANGSNRANAIFFTRYDISTLANGNNISVPVGSNAFIRLTQGTLSTAPSICGIIGAASSGGADGQVLDILNDTTLSVTFSQNTVDPVPANRIMTDSGNDLTIQYRGCISLWYDTANTRWRVANAYPLTNFTANATNAIANANGNGTNTTLWQAAVVMNSLSLSNTTASRVLILNAAQQATNEPDATLINLSSLPIKNYTNALTSLRTNSVTVGSVTGINYGYGLTGVVASSELRLGVSAAPAQTQMWMGGGTTVNLVLGVYKYGTVSGQFGSLVPTTNTAVSVYPAANLTVTGIGLNTTTVTIGSGTNITFALQTNGVDAITTVLTGNASRTRVLLTGLSIAVTTNDTVNVRWVCDGAVASQNYNTTVSFTVP